jgi:hypothetical protein
MLRMLNLHGLQVMSSCLQSELSAGTTGSQAAAAVVDKANLLSQHLSLYPSVVIAAAVRLKVHYVSCCSLK